MGGSDDAFGQTILTQIAEDQGFDAELRGGVRGLKMTL